MLLTDATPGSDEACEDWDEVADTAAVGFDEGRGSRTHVISVVGPGGVLESHYGRLGAIARSSNGMGGFCEVMVVKGRDDGRPDLRACTAN